MGRFARVAVPDYFYHVTHRGNRRARIFVGEEDREVYCAWLRKYCDLHALEVFAWCLMTNHVHLIVQPRHSSSLARALGNAHGKYAQWFNAHYGISGHLWQGRFFSTPLDEEHLWAAVRYVELNPVRAALVGQAQAWRWSSAAAHVQGGDDLLLSKGGPFAGGRIGDWASWLHEGVPAETIERIRTSTQTGRPCGNVSFVLAFEQRLERLLRPLEPGPKPRDADTLTDDFFS